MTIRSQRNYERSSLSPTVKQLVECVVPLSLNLASNATIADTNETTLKTYALPANAFGANGIKGLEVEAYGRYGATAVGKTVKFKFGTVVFTSGAIVANGINWSLRAKVIRVSASVQVIVVEFVSGTTLVTLSNVGGTEAETAAITLLITGQNAAANANDIICNHFSVKAIEDKKIT